MRYRFYNCQILIVTRLVVFSILLIASVVGYSQPDFRFRSVTMSDGLSANGVRAIAQDCLGFIWFGTDNGLCRYDGIRIVPVRLGCDSDTLPQTILSMLSLPDKLIVGTTGGLFSLSLVTGKSARLFPEAITSSVTAISRSKPDGKIWVSTVANGVAAFSDSLSGLQAYDIPQFNNHITALLADSKGNVWISGFNNSSLIMFLPKGASSFEPHVLDGVPSDFMARCIIESDKGAIGYGTWDHGVFSISPDFKASLVGESLSCATHIHSILQLADGEYLVGSDNGLLWVDRINGVCKLFTSDNSESQSLNNNFVHSIFRDREGGIWVGTFYGGVNYYNPLAPKFTNYISGSQDGSIKGDVVSCFCYQGPGRLWIGTDDGGLCCMDTESGLVTKHFGGLNVHALCIDDGYLWVGTYSNGIKRIRLSDNKIESYDTSQFNGISCYSIFRDSRGNLWAASWGGLFLYDRPHNTFRHVMDLGGLAYDICEDSSRNIWIATQGAGLYCFAPDKYSCQHYMVSADTLSLPCNDVNCLAIGPGPSLYVATSHGICKHLGGGKFQRVAVELPSQEVSFLTFCDSLLIISTNKGLVACSDGSLRHYTTADGLCSDQFMTASGICIPGGRVYLGTTHGICSFAPSDMPVNTIKPEVRLVDLEAQGRRPITDTSFCYKQFFCFGADTNYFDISFAALSYCSPGKNKYYFKIEGRDSSWFCLGSRSSIHIGDIEPGRYRLVVMASNNDGVLSNPVGLNLEIRRGTLFYMLWVALCVMALAFLAMLLIRRRKPSEESLPEPVLSEEPVLVGLTTPDALSHPSPEPAAVHDDSIAEDEKFKLLLMAIISDNIQEPDLNANFLADKLGLSRSSLFAKIRQSTGKTPNELITSCRLQRAYDMFLADKTLRVSDVAYSVGFNNPSYFSKLFIKQYGCRPSDVK